VIGRSSKAARTRSPSARLVFGAIITAAVWAWAVSARAADLVIPGGHEAEIVQLVAPYELGGEVADGFRLDGIQIGQRRIDFVLATKTATAERVTVTLTLRSAGHLFGMGSAYELSVDPPGERQSPSARRAARMLTETIAHHADRAFWDRVLGAPVGARPPLLPRFAPARRATLVAVAAVLVVLGATAMYSRAATRIYVQVWTRLAAPVAVAATAVAIPAVAWLLTGSTFGGVGDPQALSQYRHALQRELAGWSLWVAVTACEAAAILTILRGFTRQARARLVTAATVAVDAAAVMAWSAVVRFVLTQPNILTDGGSGYGRLWRQSVPGWQGLSVLIEAAFPQDPRFMWTIIRVPWVLATLAPPLLLLLARALGFGRARALFAGVALASLPLHAAMYSSDFELGPLLSFDLLGLALVAAAVRFERAELAAAGAAVLAYACWGRPDAPIVGAALVAIAVPVLVRWRAQPVLVAGLGWFAVNAVASFVSAWALGAGSHLTPHLWAGFPVLRFVGLQEVVPFWLILPLPFGVAHLLVRDPRRLAVIGIGIIAGLVPLSLSPVGNGDPTGSYMEYFRYGTWALPWIVLVAAEGMDAGVGLVARRFGRVDPARAHRMALAARATIVAVCMATPLVFRSYLARQYGPRVEEEAFRDALDRVPDDCGLVVPHDYSDLPGVGTIELMRPYVYNAEEAAAQGKSRVHPERIVGVTDFLRSAAEHRAVPPLPSAAAPVGDRADPACWYYFRGSYCYTGLFGLGSRACAEIERDAVLDPVLARNILYISHRLVTRPDRSDPPFYDPAQSLVLSKIVGWRTDVADAAAVR
jgi:hypothetical protein